MNTQTRISVRSTTVFLMLILSSVLFVSPSFASTPADSDISYWVKSALRNDERVDASTIDVAVKNGIVTLSGEVTSLAEKAYAVRDARKVRGVANVVDELQIVPVNEYADDDICHMVRRRILNSSLIHSDNIKVDCTRGKVTLSGEVASWSERDAANLLTYEIGGVKDVENRIIVTGQPKLSDEEIKNRVATLFSLDVYLSGLPITVSVKDGVVTLTGTVDSDYEKGRATRKAFQLQVKEVVNNLQVKPGQSREERGKTVLSGEKLKEAVATVLKLDGRINATRITVAANYGHVTLDGSVDNAYEKRLAEQDAKDVIGVAWVSNNLVLSTPKRSDAFIRDDVNFNLNTDYLLDGVAIAVRVNRGVVTLSGQVHNWYQKTRAEEIAEKVKGVKQVINHLRVYRETSKSDQELTREVKKRLKWNWNTWWVHDKINVEVVNGVAILTGDVDTWSERKEAARVAFHTKGIWEVDNRLTVNGFSYKWDKWYKNVPDRLDPYFEPDKGSYRGLYNERWW